MTVEQTDDTLIPLADRTRVVTTDRGDVGCRLDLVVRRHLRGAGTLSRTRVQGWIENGLVRVNGSPVRRVAARAAFGDVVTVTLTGPPRQPMAGEDIRLDILHEDDDLLAVDKPAGVVVHPTRAHPTATLMNALLWHAREWPAPLRPSLVGRLDKLTSGIVLVAKTASSHAALQQAMRAAATEKDYLAVVYGREIPRDGQIDLAIHDDATARRRIASAGEPGMASLTHFERLASVPAPGAGLAVLRCRLGTGRTHQIRVHLAARGWPIVGDPIYGEPRWSEIVDPTLADLLSAFPRQALHAWRLRLIHPRTGAPLHLVATVPTDIERLLTAADLPTVFGAA